MLRFPLFERAERLGVLDGGSALIVAPTATGKSHIGREAICRALKHADGSTQAYLVPFRALAEEVHDSFLRELAGTKARVRITTGDHRDPIRPEDADLIVATYESFAALLRRDAFRPRVVVADEVHLLADDDRGPVVEGLFARLLASGRIRALCALSAVVENAEPLAAWLGIPLLLGTPEDRPVPLTVSHDLTDDLDQALLRSLEPCRAGRQGLVFCSSRPGAEKAARSLAEVIEGSLEPAAREALQTLVEEIQKEDPAAEDVVRLFTSGVAYHHAGLPKPIRHRIEKAYREGHLRILTATPTLAAGVNLPADIAVVRDVFRSDTVRGTYRRVLLPSGEVLNMLGRAARPHHVSSGVGVALIDRKVGKDPQVQELITAIKAGKGGTVSSRLPDSFEGIMRFVLAVVVERGETTREDIASAYTRTLAYHADPRPVHFDRSFEEDMMEDLPAYRKVVEAGGSIRLMAHHLSPAGVHATIASGDKKYEVSLAVIAISCTCPAASQFYRGRICKHQACAIHDLLFGKGISAEVRHRTIYICGHVFSRTLDPGTLLAQALEVLTAWGSIERVPSGWRATPLGDVASASGFDLLLVHQAATRVADARADCCRDVAHWAVADYIAEEKDQARWYRAIDDWLEEVDAHKIKLPTKYRGDFERRLEDLARVCLLYEKAAEALGKHEIGQVAHAASGAVRYGVAPELVPLMALGLPQLARGRSRYLHERGVRNLQDLASADPPRLADPRRAPEALVKGWVTRAKEIFTARAVASADREEAEQEFDELVARFRLDPAALA